MHRIAVLFSNRQYASNSCMLLRKTVCKMAENCGCVQRLARRRSVDAPGKPTRALPKDGLTDLGIGGPAIGPATRKRQNCLGPT
jgi:hypothetical protein